MNYLITFKFNLLRQVEFFNQYFLLINLKTQKMKKTNAEILNAIPSGMNLETYFDSLDIFDERELINELEVCKGHFAKNLKPKIYLALFSYACSFLCYFGIREEWFIYYLIGINMPLSILLLWDIKDALFYMKVIKILERRLSK